MNIRPWNIDDLVRMEQASVQKEMQRIHRLTAGMGAQVSQQRPPVRILGRLLAAAKGWLRHAQKPAHSLRPQPHGRRD